MRAATPVKRCNTDERSVWTAGKMLKNSSYRWQKGVSNKSCLFPLKYVELV